MGYNAAVWQAEGGGAYGWLTVGTRTLFFFFHPIILFSNSFFDFPLFFEYFPIILIILHDLGTYAALRAWLETRLTSNLPYTTESTRVGKSWRTKTIKQRRLIDDRVRLY